MSYRSTRPVVLAFVALVVASANAFATEPEKFVRYTDNKDGGALETAVVTYKNDAGVELKLVSAIHIGEKSYFDALSKDFESQDAVLYELVKEKDALPPGPGTVRRQAADDEGDDAIDMIGKLQRFLKDTLNLEFQLDAIDYTKKNFVHADMDRETFEKAQADRGESFEKIMMQQLLSAMTKPSAFGLDANSNDTFRDLIKVLTRPDAERQMKTFLAKQMNEMQDVASGLDGPGGSVILTERNKAAIKVLGETLKAGKKKISIFYGAAHMPDLDERVREMGFKREDKVEWNKAWDLHIRADEPSAIEELLTDLFGAETATSPIPSDDAQ